MHCMCMAHQAVHIRRIQASCLQLDALSQLLTAVLLTRQQKDFVRLQATCMPSCMLNCSTVHTWLDGFGSRQRPFETFLVQANQSWQEAGGISSAIVSLSDIRTLRRDKAAQLSRALCDWMQPRYTSWSVSAHSRNLEVCAVHRCLHQPGFVSRTSAWRWRVPAQVQRKAEKAYNTGASLPAPDGMR